ncbi:MAG: FAD-binding protein [Halomonadaceae bacterium]|nr:MAG: FAD-binding protein [Halomonadaceae bacterium]
MSFSIAIIGSGMAGLAAAYGCRQQGHSVTVFEAQQGHGMDAHALSVAGGLVDVPLRVMSPASWPSVIALAAEVGVGTFAVKTRVSCNWSDRKTWFRSGELPLLKWPFAGSLRYMNPRGLRLGRGLLQLKGLTGALEQADSRETLEQVLQRQSFDPLFWRGLILPILTTICTCEEKHLLQWPAAQLLGLLHGIVHDATLYRLQGGTSALVKGLAKDLPLYAGSPVAKVVEEGDKVRVHNDRGEGGLYDRVIIATQANQLQFLDASQFARELQVLSDIRFDSGELWVHQDRRFLPAHRRDWTALNFHMDRELKKPVFTVWVNAVEPSLNRDDEPVLQTWNPLFEPAPETVLARVPLQRAVVHLGTARVHEQLQQWHQEPGRKVFFCGSWAHDGVPLLESAVRSAQSVVRCLN